MILGIFHLTQNSGNFGWYGPFRFGPSEILGTSFEWSTLIGPVISVGRTEMSLSIRQNCLSPVPLYSAYKNNNQPCGLLGRVCRQPECTAKWARGISKISKRNFCSMESAH